MVSLGISSTNAVSQTVGAHAVTRSAKLPEPVAVNQFRVGKLSVRQLGDSLGMTYRETVRFLVEHKIPLNLSVSDVQAADISEPSLEAGATDNVSLN